MQSRGLLKIEPRYLMRRKVLPDLCDIADQLIAQPRYREGESDRIPDRPLDDPNLIEVLRTVF